MSWTQCLFVREALHFGESDGVHDHKMLIFLHGLPTLKSEFTRARLKVLCRQDESDMVAYIIEKLH